MFRALLFVLIGSEMARAGRFLDDGGLGYPTSSNSEEEEISNALEQHGLGTFVDDTQPTANGFSAYIQSLGKANSQSNDPSEEKVLNSEPAKEWRDSFVEIYNETGFTCGGIRIAAGLVLSSAHCFFKAKGQNKQMNTINCTSDLNQWQVILRPNNRKSETLSISRVYKNWQFRYNQEWKVLSGDEAVVVLNGQFTTDFREKFEWAPANERKPISTDKCYALGVGHRQRKRMDRRPSTVHKGYVTVREDCDEIIPFGRNRPSELIFCTTTGGTHGDSGGPVICDRTVPTKFSYLMGIISQVHEQDEDVTIVSSAMKTRRWIDKFLNKKRGHPEILRTCTNLGIM